MSKHLVVNTTKRPGDADYFTATIAAVDAQIASASAADLTKIVFSDGPFDKKLPDGWTLVYLEGAEAQGTLPSLQAIVQLAKNGSSDLLMLEDDILLAPNAMQTMLDYVVPDDLDFVSFFDFYTPAGHAPGLERRGYDRGKPLQAGVQAVKLPRRSLELMWNPSLPMWLPTPPGPSGKLTGRLAAIKYFFGNFSPSKQFGVHFPHLVQHVDGVSAVNGIGAQRAAAEGRKRISLNFTA